MNTPNHHPTSAPDGRLSVGTAQFLNRGEAANFLQASIAAAEHADGLLPMLISEEDRSVAFAAPTPGGRAAIARMAECWNACEGISDPGNVIPRLQVLNASLLDGQDESEPDGGWLTSFAGPEPEADDLRTRIATDITKAAIADLMLDLLRYEQTRLQTTQKVAMIATLAADALIAELGKPSAIAQEKSHVMTDAKPASPTVNTPCSKDCCQP